MALPALVGASFGLPFLGLSLLSVYQEGYNSYEAALAEKVSNIIYCVFGVVGLLISVGVIINKLPSDFVNVVEALGALSLFSISSTIVYSPGKAIYKENDHKVLKIFAICMSSIVIILAILFCVIELALWKIFNLNI